MSCWLAAVESDMMPTCLQEKDEQAQILDYRKYKLDDKPFDPTFKSQANILNGAKTRSISKEYCHA